MSLSGSIVTLGDHRHGLDPGQGLGPDQRRSRPRSPTSTRRSAKLSAGAAKFSIQATFTQKLSDTLTAGIGNLVDANMAQESALLAVAAGQAAAGRAGAVDRQPGAADHPVAVPERLRNHFRSIERAARKRRSFFRGVPEPCGTCRREALHAVATTPSVPRMIASIFSQQFSRIFQRHVFSSKWKYLPRHWQIFRSRQILPSRRRGRQILPGRIFLPRTKSMVKQILNPARHGACLLVVRAKRPMSSSLNTRTERPNDF